MNIDLADSLQRSDTLEISVQMDEKPDTKGVLKRTANI
jgi:hypothetical protein